MTTFLDTAQQILQRAITLIRDASFSSDSSTKNTALTFMTRELLRGELSTEISLHKGFYFF